MKPILDACCGGRMFWYDKNNPLAVYGDKRIMQDVVAGKGRNARTRRCLPDVKMDFRNMPFRDETFYLVVFDPPHLFVGENSYTAISYGRLEKGSFKEDIKSGFSECFRVLREKGVLIFKWNEYDVPVKTVLSLASYYPLFGHQSGKAQRTHWICFIKSEKMLKGGDHAQL